MPDKKPSPAALMRKIERLEAQVSVLRKERQQAMHNYFDKLAEVVDLQMRAEQAVRLLNGEDV